MTHLVAIAKAVFIKEAKKMGAKDPHLAWKDFMVDKDWETELLRNVLFASIKEVVKNSKLTKNQGYERDNVKKGSRPRGRKQVLNCQENIGDTLPRVL